MVADAAVTQQPFLGAFVREILEHPADRPWVMQGIGLLGLRLDEARVYRLHVWDPASCIGEAPIHDHPFDFTSTVIAGEITNLLWEESPSGVEYQRDRYTPPDEDARATDTVRLTSTSTTFTAGETYAQRAYQLHSSAQVPGTVTVLRRTFRDVRELTVCRRPGSPWISGASRPASPDEVRRITAAARNLLD
ncbi:MAG TPA: hypothetical protein VFC33_17025 [Acidimicrobiia bacterium]|nr:hypothetical protein [Acidimicrobiia bacterium]